MIWLAIWTWIKENWQGLAAGLALGMCLMIIKGAISSPVPPQAIASAGASQSLSGTATAHSGGSVEIPGRAAMPCPESKVCPEIQPIIVKYDCNTAISGHGSSSVSATASINNGGTALGIDTGLGYRSDTSIEAKIGVRYGSAWVDAASNSIGAWRAGAGWTWYFK